MKKLIILLPIGVLIWHGCKQANLESTEYINWVENADHGLRVSKQICNITFDLQYKPLSYIVLRENNMTHPGESIMQKRISELKGMQYYTLRISDQNKEDILKTGSQVNTEYYGRLEYFSSIMQNDIYLVDGKDTLPCLLFHYERNYNLSPYSNFLLGFEELNQKQSDRTLIFDDQAFGLGTIQLTVPKNAIEELPALKED